MYVKKDLLIEKIDNIKDEPLSKQCFAGNSVFWKPFTKVSLQALQHAVAVALSVALVAPGESG